MEINLTTNMADQIIQVIESLAQKFGVVIDWTADNVMPYVKGIAEKLVGWEIATSWMWVCIGGALLLFALIPFILEITDRLDTDCCMTIIFCVMGFIFLAICGVQAYDIITCKKFPEKFILEYIQNYIAVH